MCKKTFFRIPWFIFHYIMITRIDAQSKSRQGISYKVNPQNLGSNQRYRHIKQNCHKYRNNFAQITGQEKYDCFFNIVINIASFFNSMNYCREIVVCQYHISCTLSNVCACNTHSYADICKLQGRCVIYAIAGHRYNISMRLKCADNLNFVFRRYT
ncbi:hypothetical protein SDC9_96553 [bioreactor metagenome]|uniref:Uncharacterized protein n=1 Tax=bioreactor metagenome TaxID=1076179 RepID=A0A645AC18_9ZZZZ